MSNKLLSNKKCLIGIIAGILIVVGIVFAVLANWGSKESKKPDEGIVTEKDQLQENEENDRSEKQDGDKLEIRKEVDGKVNSVDASGSWDGKETTDGKKNHGNTKEKSENEILVDEKIWGEIY